MLHNLPLERQFFLTGFLLLIVQAGNEICIFFSYFLSHRITKKYNKDFHEHLQAKTPFTPGKENLFLKNSVHLPKAIQFNI